MSNSARVKVEVDMKALDATLGRIAAGVRRAESLKAGLREALAPTAAQAIATAPKPGDPDYTPIRGIRRRASRRLADNIGTSVGIADGGTARGAIVWALVGPRYPGAAHGHLVEFGHRIVTRGTVARIYNPKHPKLRMPKAKRGVTGGGQIMGKSRPNPFMLPAFSATESGIMARLEAALVEEIERAAG